MKNKDAHLVVVGDGPERRALERCLEQLGLGGRVHLTGFLSHHRVPAVLAHADVFVMPSRYEELGSALVEAMHVGVPIVASRTGGIPDVIAHGESGLLADPGDPAAFADAIDRLVADSGLARRLGEGARRAAGAYDWDALAERVLGVYRAVASRDQGSVKGL
jgi:glycosyltransferase involved in cell wall biosynthesis